MNGLLFITMLFHPVIFVPFFLFGMAITQAVCDSFKVQLLQGIHNFTVLTGTNTVSSVAAASGTRGPNGTATTVYTGTFTNGGSDAYAGLVLCASGWTAGGVANNGTFLCIHSSTTVIELCNPNGVNSVSGSPLINTTTDVFAIALYTSSATLSKSTTAYTSSNEVSSSGTYVTGGINFGNLVGNAMALVSTTPVLSTDTACGLFASISWTSATITARGALIYNASLGGQPAVQVLNFTTDQTSTAGTFTINFPAQTAGNAVLQLA